VNVVIAIVHEGLSLYFTNPPAIFRNISWERIVEKKVLLIFSTILLLISFCTQKTVTDVDGNIYHTVKIGNQIWMTENFRSTKFNDGTSISHVPDSVSWHSLATPGYCFFGNTTNPDTIKLFGALYNWYCTKSDKFAPPGWHVPTDEDWEALQDYLIKHGYNWDGVKSGNRIGKSLAVQFGWKPFGIKGMPGNCMEDNNRSGFSGFPAGFRYDSRDSAGWYPVFRANGHKAAWWSATEIDESIATVYVLGFCVDYLIKFQQWLKTCGYSVRLVKDSN
jgi:uncharacterized protein (TIGR02145 family)